MSRKKLHDLSDQYERVAGFGVQQLLASDPEFPVTLLAKSTSHRIEKLFASAWVTDDHGADERSLDALYHRPGFMLRRANQISVALFLEETANLGLTTTQYDAMVVLRARGSLDQVGIATLVGIDRSTTALVVSKLEEAGYIERRDDAVDKRRKIITLSAAGRAMLDRVAIPAQRAHERVLEAFSPKDARKFLQLLEQFVNVFNEKTRAPIRPTADPKRK